MSVAAAREAMARGERIAVKSEGSWLDLSGIRFKRPAAAGQGTGQASGQEAGQMAYRQAGMFVTFLRDSNPAAFTVMLGAVIDGRPLAEASAATAPTCPGCGRRSRGTNDMTRAAPEPRLLFLPCAAHWRAISATIGVGES